MSDEIARGRRVVGVHALSRLEAVCQDLDEGYRRTTRRGHTMEIAFATLSADGTRAATAAVSGAPKVRSEVFVWDADAGSVLHRREITGEGIDRVALDPTGRRLALSAYGVAPAPDGTGSRKGPFVAVVDVDTGRELLHREVADTGGFQALGFSGDGRRLAAAGADRRVLIWDLDGGTAAVESRQGPPEAMDLTFSPDGSRLAVASRQQVKLMDTETAEEVAALDRAVALAPRRHGAERGGPDLFTARTIRPRPDLV